MSKVIKITVNALIERMDEMEIGDVIGLACYRNQDGEGEDWFAVTRIDLSKVDSESKVWIIEYFGGSGNPAIVTDYDNGEYLETDLRRALDSKELMQENGTVWIDAWDYKIEKHLYIVEIEWRNDDDGPWFVAGELVNMIAKDPKYLIETAEKHPLRHNERIIVRQIADDVDWRTVEVVEPEMYTNVYMREG